MPIPLKLMQYFDVGARKKERRAEKIGETPSEVTNRYLGSWQKEWSTAETGRFTFGLLLDIQERLDLKHLNEIEHVEIRLFTGQGAFGDYLYKHRKKNNSLCPLCEEEDGPKQFNLQCRKAEERNKIAMKYKKMKKIGPWYLSTLLRDEHIPCMGP